MPDVGAPELMIILIVVLVLFGGAKLPQLARNLGSAKKEFEKGMEGDKAKVEPAATEAIAPVRTSSEPADADHETHS